MNRLAQQVMERCDQLSMQSEDTSQIRRLFLTAPVREVHRLISEWMVSAGMSVRIDAVGNIIGRRQGPAEATSKILIIGSHLDTVPNAGKYDGILGVMLGIAAVEALKEDDIPFAIDVIGFSEEEGVRFGFPFIGSRAVAGTFDFQCLNRKDADGQSVETALRQFGLAPENIPAAAYRPEEVLGYIEAHLEQGPVLEAKKIPVAIVEGIIGQSRLNLAFHGEAGHAGTVPTEYRRDALVGAARWIDQVRQLADDDVQLRATVGRLGVYPNASNVIPARVELSLDVRHPNDDARQRAVEELISLGRSLAERGGLRFEVLQQTQTPTVRSSTHLRRSLEEAMDTIGIQGFRMTSGAGHDAMIMAERFPMAMLFLRHPGGISHHPDERVDIEDVEVAMDVLKHFVLRLAKEVTS
jgi:allantoate deiminase